MIIINEYEYVKHIIDSKIIPKDMSNKRLLVYIAKYFYDPDFSVDDYKNCIFEEMKKFALPINHYQEYKYDSYVTGLCAKLLSGEVSSQLRIINHVDVYCSELDIINRCENDKERKLLFTLYVLAKINGLDSGWVNNETRDLFSLANVTATTTDRALLIHKLYKKGLIKQNHKNDKLGYKVELGSADEKVAIRITSFENIGNQYIANFKPGWKMCEQCGKLVKIKGNRQKYCKRCYEKINEADARNRMKKYRENDNVTF